MNLLSLGIKIKEEVIVVTDECFRILGIEKTTDEKLIKQAYREKLVDTNPEDDPEGFKRLRKAYDDACRYARNPEEGEGIKGAEKQSKDETPSGLWLEKAKAIYADIRKRQTIEEWEQLFKEDAFISLEDEENCRVKLLVFLLNKEKDMVFPLCQRSGSLLTVPWKGKFRSFLKALFLKVAVPAHVLDYGWQKWNWNRECSRKNK